MSLSEVVAKGVVVGSISKFNVAEKVGYFWPKIPLSEDFINTIEVGFSDIELTKSLNIATINSKVRWHFLTQIVEGLSHVVNKLSLWKTLLRLLVFSLTNNSIVGVRGLLGEWVRVIVLEAAFEALLRCPLFVANAVLFAEGSGLWS